MGYTEVVPDKMYPELQEITDVLKSGVCSHQKSKKFFSQDPSPTSTFGSCCFLDLEPLQESGSSLDQ